MRVLEMSGLLATAQAGHILSQYTTLRYRAAKRWAGKFSSTDVGLLQIAWVSLPGQVCACVAGLWLVRVC